MELVEKAIRDFRTFLADLPCKKIDLPAKLWPAGGPRNIVLGDDVGAELGNPQDTSLACVLWSDDIKAINDGSITLVGPDLAESAGKTLPFGKVVLVGVEGFNEDNIYERCMELDHLRYGIDLDGFMLRAISQHQREWCRISKAALKRGFAAGHLAAVLMKMLKNIPYVRSAEIVFLTSSAADIKKLREIVNPVFRLIAAMDKMAGEMDFDCDTCEYDDVCDEAEGLREMRARAMKKAAQKEEQTRG